MVLDRIERPNDIKKIDPSEYAELASEIRAPAQSKIVGGTNGNADDLTCWDGTKKHRQIFCTLFYYWG